MHITDEIWSYVFSHFECPISRKGWQNDDECTGERWQDQLLALCLVNSQFRRTAQRVLYRSIPIESRFVLHSKNSSLYVLFLRTLHENPTLAGNIRELKFWGAERGYNTRDRIRSALQDLELHWSLTGRLRRCLFRSGAASLLLAHTPNVELVDCTIADPKSGIPWMLSGILGLEDDVQFVWEPHRIENRSDFLFEEAELFFNPSQRKTNSQQPLTGSVRKMSVNYNPLPNLKEVRIKAEDVREAFIPAWAIEPILLNPNLKTLRTLGIDWYMPEEDKFKWPTHRSNLECLDLGQAIVDPSTLKTVMIRCPKLKSLSVDLANLYRKDNGDGDAVLDGFVYNSGGDDDDDDDDDNDEGNDDHDNDSDGNPIYDFIVDLKELGHVLREYGGNLEYLSFSTFHQEDDYGGTTMGGLGSLRELNKLRHLKIEYGNLLGEFEGNLDHERFSDVLPASIEVLHLYNGRYSPAYYSYPEPDTPNGTDSLVKAFLSEAETCAPNLRKVVVEWYDSASQWKDMCKRYWSRETIDEGWDIQFVEEQFEQGFPVEGFVMTLVILTKKYKGH